MAVAKVIEIISGSKESFDDAVRQGVAKATDSLSDVSAAWIKDQSVVVEDGKVVEYRVNMRVTFVIRGKASGKKKK